MIKLKDILLESKASEEAKKAGLKHTAFGRYADKSGKIVAMSRNGKLVYVHAARDSGKRPKSTKKDGPNVYSPDGISIEDLRPEEDMIKAGRGKGEYTSKHYLKELIKGEETTIYAPLEWAFQHSGTWKWKSSEYEGSNLTLAGAGARSAIAHARLRHRGTSAMGKSVVQLAYPEWSASEIETLWSEMKRESVHARRTDVKEWTATAAKDQYTKWRSKQPKDETAKSLHKQKIWQKQGNWGAEDATRTKRNQFWNAYIKDGENPATISVPPDGHLTRGLYISANEADGFLEKFEIGKEMCLPPSGFSAEAAVGTSFSKMSVPARAVAIILRVYPPKGKKEMTGLLLSGANEGSDEMPEYYKTEEFIKSLSDAEVEEIRWGVEALKREVAKRPELAPPPYLSDEEKELYYVKQSREIMKAIDVMDASLFDREAEVIRPGNIKQKVRKVEKHVFAHSAKQESDDTTAAPEIIYVIELEETGWEEDASLVMEGVKSPRKTELLFKYLNKSLHFAGEVVKKPTKNVLAKYMNTNLRGK